jgi:predicted metal-dependent peptidase
VTTERAILEKITRARISLILDEPYLATAIAQFPLEDATEEGWCSTMATDGYRIYYNADFCRCLRPKDLSFVLAHEVGHCIFGHLERRGERDQKKWNLATDFAINLVLHDFGMRVPAGAVFSLDFKDLTAEDIYDKLPKRKSSQGKGKNGRGSGGSSGGAQSPLWRFDGHLEFPPRKQPVKSELREIRRACMEPLEKSLRTRGTMPGWWDETVRKATGREIPWRELLSHYFSGLRRDNYRWLPPNKKHIWRGLVLPSVGVPSASHIVAAIDTSGSMSNEVLGQTLGMLDSLRRVNGFTLTVLQCDWSVQEVKNYELWDEPDFSTAKFRGRGGTSFVPVFEWLEQQMAKGMRPDALFFFTDLCGNFPDKAPCYPVAWLAFDRDLKPPFGQVIRVL